MGAGQGSTAGCCVAWVAYPAAPRALRSQLLYPLRRRTAVMFLDILLVRFRFRLKTPGKKCGKCKLLTRLSGLLSESYDEAYNVEVDYSSILKQNFNYVPTKMYVKGWVDVIRKDKTRVSILSDFVIR